MVRHMSAFPHHVEADLPGSPATSIASVILIAQVAKQVDANKFGAHQQARRCRAPGCVGTCLSADLTIFSAHQQIWPSFSMLGRHCRRRPQARWGWPSALPARPWTPPTHWRPPSPSCSFFSEVGLCIYEAFSLGACGLLARVSVPCVNSPSLPFLNHSYPLPHSRPLHSTLPLSCAGFYANR